MTAAKENKKELKRLRKKLSGYYQLVADKAEVTKPMVSMVLGGKASSQKVIEKAYEVEQLIDSLK